MEVIIILPSICWKSHCYIALCLVKSGHSLTKEAFDKVVFHHASISDAISST